MFGRGFTLRDKTVNGVGAAVSGGSHAGPHTKEMGYIAYFEVRITLKKKTTHVYLMLHQPVETELLGGPSWS
jgi:hypothetical protein